MKSQKTIVSAPEFPNPPASAPRPDFFQKLFMGILEPMYRGALRLELPDGSVRTFGHPNIRHPAVIRVRNPRFFKRCILSGDIGFGESYVDGDWESDSVRNVIAWALLNLDAAPNLSGSKRKFLSAQLMNIFNRARHVLRRNSRKNSRKNIHEHYDLSNKFFQLFLDPSLTYSAAYFETPEQPLEEAQRAKYDALCRKLKLKSTDHVLEIGSGWGGFSLHAVRNYGCRITTVTISEEQYALAKKRFSEAGLSDRIDIKLCDYRELKGSYDKIVSIEMLEAVGEEYIDTYFAKCHELLAKDGLLGIQVITSPDSRYHQFKNGVDWIQKHIFPGSLLPSVARMNQATLKTGDLFLHDLEDLGNFYAKTLRIWRDCFNEQIDQVRALNFDEPFIRKWNYYLSYCEAAFAMRNISVVQVIYTRPNNLQLSSDHAETESP